MLKKHFLILLLSLLFHASFSQADRSHWVDSVFNTLKTQEKAAQLFMVPASSFATEDEMDDLIDLVKDDGIGGIYITRGGPVSHAEMVNKLQSASPARLLIGISAEWGLAQTLDSTMGFQKPLLASVWKDDSLTSLWGKAIASQMKMLGLHINFAPNADDEIFPGDYLRYFGNQKNRLASRTVTFTRALQSEGIMAVARHLPRTWSDELPLNDSTILLNLNNIETEILWPFQQLVNAKVSGIATSYLHFSIQNRKGIVPTAISQLFISEVLKKKLHFTGLVFSDVRDVRIKAKKVRSGEAELLAFQSGADILMNPQNVSAGIRKIARAARKNKVLLQQLDASVRKIIETKFDAGLENYQPINTDNLARKLHDPTYYLTKDRLASASITVLQNADSLIPIRKLDNVSFVCISVGREANNEFTHYLKKYAPFRLHSIRTIQDTSAIVLQPNEIIVMGIFPNATPLELALRGWFDRVSIQGKLIAVHFGNPFSLGLYTRASALLAAYTDQDKMQVVVPQVIFGGLRATGTLPMTVGPWQAGRSIETKTWDRVSYGVPEAAGISSRKLEKIRVIMDEAIAMGATPGCQTLIIKDGKVVYEQSAGSLAYDSKNPVTEETIYDLASVTKISATLQAVMFMQEKGLINVNKKVSVYLPELKNSNKSDFTIKDILTHQAGLWPFLPFWAQTMKDNLPMPEYYSNLQSPSYPFPVSENLFASSTMKDSLWQWIIRAKIREKPPRTPYDYRYSDMGFYILQHLAEKLLNQPLEIFLDENLYRPLGAYTTGYLPLQRFAKDRIAPTERDTLFRKTLLTGYVHDQGAAMHGGIAGHAGLFSTATDLAKVGQMWLQKGHYGGNSFFKPETIEIFSTKQFSDSRRGLGWDKSTPGDWNGPTARFASSETFGHTGFTGTCIWVDPAFNLVFVFLSNRVQPDMNNNKLLTANIRPRIQEVVYEAIFDYRATQK